MMSVAEIANKLNVTPKTVQRWITEKRLPAYQFGREYRIKEEDFNWFVESSKTVKDSE